MAGAESLTDRFKGSLVGLAVGDALGAAVEFRKPGTFEPVDGMRGGGPHGLEAGQWTDDTSMALCLAESLISCSGFDAADQMGRYVRWYREGHMSCTGSCFDIGNATRASLERYEETGEANSGSAAADSAGNGSIMRLAPAPLFFSRDLAEAVRMSGRSSLTTHGAAACVDACRYLGGLIAGAARGERKDVLLSECYGPPGEWARRPLCAEIGSVAAGSFKYKEPPEIRGTGYVADSLEAALWAFHRSSSFGEGCLLAANLGDDADTTAAVFGQLAGAYYGIGGIPAEWRALVAGGPMIEGMAEKLRDAGGQRSARG